MTDPVYEIKQHPRPIRKDVVIGEHELSDMYSLGYFGNIWVRSHHYPKAGMTNGGGHRHNFDHVTLLAKGSVRIVVEGFEPKEFHAPTFIVIKKEFRHHVTALEDDTLYYCVFAMRDVNGEVVEDMYEGRNNPYAAGVAKDEVDVKQRLRELDQQTTKE